MFVLTGLVCLNYTTLDISYIVSLMYESSMQYSRQLYDILTVFDPWISLKTMFSSRDMALYA